MNQVLRALSMAKIDDIQKWVMLASAAIAAGVSSWSLGAKFGFPGATPRKCTRGLCY